MPPEDASDAVRRAAGFLTVGEVAALVPEVSVLDHHPDAPRRRSLD